MDCTPPGSSVHGILQATILEWVAMPSSTGSSQPRDQIHFSAALTNRFFATKFTWEALYMMYGIWHNFKRWKGDYTLWVFLLVLCTFTHSSWVSLSLPNMYSLFLKVTTTVLCWFLASMEPKGQGGGLPKWDRIDFQHNTVAFMESIGFFYLFHLWTPFSLLGYPAFLLSSLNRYLPFPSH